MRWTRRTVLIPAVALLVLALWAPSASAHEQHLEWRDGDKAGDCTGGWTSGGYVFSVQSILYASGLCRPREWTASGGRSPSRPPVPGSPGTA